MIPEPSGAGLRRTWCVIDETALASNLRALRDLTTPRALLAPAVKANAYGHGMLLAARVFESSGADWLCVDSTHEASDLRDAGIRLPLLILGYVPPAHAAILARRQCRATVYDAEQVRAIAQTAAAEGTTVPLHLKLETGTHRQGVGLDEALRLAKLIGELDGVELEGATSHFANVEDTTDHHFANEQLKRFEEMTSQLRDASGACPILSIANSAATILWPRAHHGLVRPGISAYGMWPSTETLISAKQAGRPDVALRPALQWETRIAQLKTVPPGGDVGYGCTYRATRPTRLAILPVGYYDGYDRGLSNVAHVLVRGRRAPVRGRVCMNMTMVDVTDVPNAVTGDRAVLLGQDGKEEVRAEQLAQWAATINYEVTTRIHESIPRVARTKGESPDA